MELLDFGRREPREEQGEIWEGKLPWVRLDNSLTPRLGGRENSLMTTLPKSHEIAEHTRARARASRRSYNIILVSITLTSIALILVFFGGSVTTSASTPADEQLGLWLVIIFGSLRIGAVLFGVFLIQTLSSYARYHIRLSHRLDAIADVLELIPVADPYEFAIAVAALSPDSIDFGKPPQSPTAQALDALVKMSKLERK